jgi:hypothetical protein
VARHFLFGKEHITSQLQLLLASCCLDKKNNEIIWENCLKCTTQSAGITQCRLNLNYALYYCVCFTSNIDFYQTNTLPTTALIFRHHNPSPLTFDLMVKPDFKSHYVICHPT